MPRDQIFISYSHHDRKWVEELRVTFVPVLRKRRVVLWDDSKIRVGDKWKEEIASALSRAKVAVLLVSRHFLASEFIYSSELPPLFEAAEKDGAVIFWIAVGHSLYEQTVITDYQAANDPSRPLNSLPESEMDRELVRIAKLLDSALNPSKSGEEPESLSDTTEPLPDESWTFRSRDEEIEDMVETAEKSGVTGSRVTPFTGDSGVGKSQLAQQWAILSGKLKLDESEIGIVHQRLREQLSDGRWAWRSIHALSGKAGVDEETALAILRADPEVQLGRSKEGRAIAKLRRS